MAVDPLMMEWMAQQGQSPPPYMHPNPFPSQFNAGMPPAPTPPPPAPANPGMMPQPMTAPPANAPMPARSRPPLGETLPPEVGRMTPNNPTGGLPRPIIQPKNEDIFGRYVSTYQQGRQMGQPAPEPQPGDPGWGQPAPPAPPPRYLDNAGNTAPPVGQIAPSPEDEWMAQHFPRATSLAQQLNRAQMQQTMAPQLEANLAQQKADAELSLMREKGALEQEAMRRKFKNAEMQMQQQQRKTQMQMQQDAQRAQQQQMHVSQPRPPMGGRY